MRVTQSEICALNVAKRSVNFDVKFCESSFKICSLNFRMVYAQNLYIIFLIFSLNLRSAPLSSQTPDPQFASPICSRLKFLLSACFDLKFYSAALARQSAL